VTQAGLPRVGVGAPPAFQVPVVLIALACIVALALLAQHSASTRIALLFLTGTAHGGTDGNWHGVAPTSRRSLTLKDAFRR